MSEDRWRHLARFLGIDLAELMQMECRETLRAVRRKLDHQVARGGGMSSIGDVLRGAAGLKGRRNGRGPHY